ncbi:MAG: serine O-acetyltransferase [Lachnospiraceae bacterium]|nr:serine O-acetyltransferase [Lachnospiraceae bacterium]
MNIKNTIDDAAAKLEKNYQSQGIFEMGVGDKMPNREEIINIINETRRVIFPGFFGPENTALVNLNSFAGTTLASIYEKLFRQIRVAFLYNKKKAVENVEALAEDIALKFISKLPEIQELLLKDTEAYLAGDPAAGSKEDIIFSYPGIYTIYVYRIAHILYELEVPYIPRIMTEHAHSKTGIDINPGAVIGEYFFIDHGTGIVIGETTNIGDHVKIYQGVTLGALSTMKGQELSGVKRHPTIEDNVVIYANTTVLGGNTVIGKNSVIAGNTFVTQSVPADTKVSAFMPELQIKKRN